ncbi:phage tail assembly chaperone G [Bacillus sp. 1P02SD]|uniref:phage tail assembly chaperone G n=1 Tax=Bacillus sp. 1P02SD TaxID=3132264 RepID=UPI00399EF69D
MQITIKIDGKDKTFTNDFVPGRVFRNALLINKKMKGNEEVSAELFDELIEFCVNAFGKQFTVDEFWDGIDARKLDSEVMRIYNEILSFGGLTVESNEGNEPGK